MSIDEQYKRVIAIDIDDVIATSAEAFIEYSNKNFDTNLTVDDYHDHWGEMWKVDHEETKRRAIEYHESGHIALCGLVDGAKEILELLKSKFKLKILTARRKSIDQLTIDWINKYYPNMFEEIVFCGFYDEYAKGATQLTKAELAKQIGADYLIDDQLKHVQAVAEIGIKGLLFGNYSWNRVDVLPENVVRVKNWQEVKDYFDKAIS